MGKAEGKEERAEKKGKEKKLILRRWHMRKRGERAAQLILLRLFQGRVIYTQFAILPEA